MPGMTRYHSLDLLRAFLMFLGVVLHSALIYLDQPNLYFFQASEGLSFAYPLAWFIHLFRMPAFFIIAGFFAALVYARYGFTGFLQNRLRRVFWPLVIFWPVIFVLVTSSILFA